MDIRRGPIAKAKLIPFFRLSKTDSAIVGAFIKLSIPSSIAVWNLFPVTIISGSPG